MKVTRRQINDKFGVVASQFFDKQAKLKSIQNNFDNLKTEFESSMEDMFSEIGKGCKSVMFENDDVNNEGKSLKVSKVERTTIIWDANKLEKRLEKKVARKVIRKKHYISDMSGLIDYLKTCDVDPKQFKKYLQAEKTVDQKAVDNLGQLGEITVKNISGCYVVNCSKPYYTLSMCKDE